MAGEFLSIDGSSVGELVDGLRAAERELGRQMRQANKRVAEKVAVRAQSKARGGTRAQRHFAGAVRASSTVKTARLRIAGGKANGGAGVTFWGAKTRSGWYAKARYANMPTAQHPEWVGVNWLAGRRGEGPYVLNDAVAEALPEAQQWYQDAHAEALAQAFGKD